jgi:hypothetical protein
MVTAKQKLRDKKRSKISSIVRHGEEFNFKNSIDMIFLKNIFLQALQREALN